MGSCSAVGLECMLQPRLTSICAFELVAAVVALIGFCPEVLSEADIIHYIDNKLALSCIIRGFSKQDLCSLTGRLWYEAGRPSMSNQS